MSLAASAAKQRNVLKTRNDTKNMAGWQTAKRTMIVILIISETMRADQFDDDDLVDNNLSSDVLLVCQGQRTYSMHSRVRITPHLLRFVISRSVWAIDYRIRGRYYC